MTIIAIVPPSNEINITRYLCRCDCGIEKFAILHRLYSGRTVSCGCFQKEQATALGKNNKLKEGNSKENCIISAYKYVAKKNQLDCTLTKEEFHNFFISNCYYCGISPHRTAQSKGYVSSFTFNGIDKVNPNKGYTLENCVPCCTECNKAKNNMSVEEFKTWIIRLYINFIKNKGTFKP